MNFKNKAAEEIILAITSNIGEFELKRKGAVAKNMILAIAGVFPEDRTTIFSFFSSKDLQQPAQGGANITRNEKIKTNSLPPCDGCPGSAKAVAAKSTPKRLEPKTVNTATRPFMDVADVVERFSGSIGAMMAFAQTKGVSIPSNVKKPETIARYIFEDQQNKKDESLD